MKISNDVTDLIRLVVFRQICDNFKAILSQIGFIVDWATESFDRKKTPLTKEERIMAKWTAEAMTLIQREFKKVEYRGSAMPICGHYTEVMGNKWVDVEGKKDFYVRIGTIIHELLQERFPNTRHGMRIFGNWKCRNPKCQHIAVECVNPGSCPKCGLANPRYEEVAVTYKNLITMHVDLLIQLPNKRFWLNDWKTTGLFALENPQFVGMPYPKNRAQVEGYVVALKEEKGIDVDMVFLDYTLRGDPELDPNEPKNRPFGIKITPELYQLRKLQLDRTVLEKQAFDTYVENPTLDNLRRFDTLRPCKTIEDYSDTRYGMAPSFQYHEDRKCEFANEAGCFCKGFTKPARILADRVKKGLIK